ncbi:MAG: Phosphoserine transaminase [Bogoriella megaspora]|nr:MAG: Phosphoserine transaminase [Bogoriella megaspora]
MPPREEVAYFGAGPAPLPTPVLEEASKALLNYNDMGIGIAEISHRSPEANKVLADTKEAMVSLLDIPNDYEILFLQGGGSGEFSAVVYHMVGLWVEKRRLKIEKELQGSITGGVELDARVLDQLRKELHKDLRLDYLVTGSWSLKASQEAARLVGSEYVNVALDARKANEGKFGKIPSEDQWQLSPADKSAMVYYCDNETVDGVEFPSFPSILESPAEGDERLVVADMSSNFISRRVDVRKYAVIFGGAQKNVGNTGITIVILRKSLLPPQSNLASPQIMRSLGLPISPIVFDWPTIAKNSSLYNTLPILDIWIAGKVMQSLNNTYQAQKIQGQEEVSKKKADLLYTVLDSFPDVYRVVPDKSVRSRMNICFRVHGANAEREKEFLDGAGKLNLTGLKGHRSVGGIRISNYNAVPVSAAERLARYLESYAQQK